MKQSLSTFLKWASGFFEEGNSGARSSGRLNSITSTFWTIIFAGVLVGFCVGASLNISTEASTLKVIEMFLSTIEVLVGLALTGGSINYVFGRVGKSQQKDNTDA